MTQDNSAFFFGAVNFPHNFYKCVKIFVTYHTLRPSTFPGVVFGAFRPCDMRWCHCYL